MAQKRWLDLRRIGGVNLLVCLDEEGIMRVVELGSVRERTDGQLIPGSFEHISNGQPSYFLF